MSAYSFCLLFCTSLVLSSPALEEAVATRSLAGVTKPPLSTHVAAVRQTMSCSLACSLCLTLLTLAFSSSHWCSLEQGAVYSLLFAVLTLCAYSLRRTHLVLAFLRLEEAVATRSPCRRDQPPLSNHRRDSKQEQGVCLLTFTLLTLLTLACSLLLTGAHWCSLEQGVCLLTRCLLTHSANASGLALLRLEEAVATRSPCQHDQPPLSNRRRDSSRSRVSACSSIRAGAGCLLAQCLLNACSMLAQCFALQSESLFQSTRSRTARTGI